MASTNCGWCGDRTHMAMIVDPHRLPDRRREGRSVWMAAFICASETCRRLSIGWGELRDGGKPGYVKEAFPTSQLEWEPRHVHGRVFRDVPPEIAETAREAHACLSIGAARGAVALARAVVEATAKVKGINVRGIVAKIDALRDGGIISGLTAEASHQIREDGNSIAHGDIGDEPISIDDATAILEFMDALLDEVFQRPAKLNRLKQRHADRKQGNKAGAQLPPAPGGGPA
ncbi:DUF4145 domain-containing protein [Streptomyces sp. NPDC094468]|uniref:DUF4145 domain-containing protein n=1 Tax=Streptomyces sp. NPDC094468 TaxID=3366066 RepID=UPI003800BAD0